jgi:uncharacterized RDD family membrane protein YckC
MTARRTRFDTVPVEARGFHGEPAGVITRAIANGLDLAIVVLMLVAGYLAVAGAWFLRRGADFRFPVVSYREAYAAGFVTLVVYFTLSWSAGGRTYGDRVLGLRVRTMDDLDLTLLRSLIRSLLCAAFPLLLVWVAISPEARSVQDIIVRTHVVYDWGGTRTSRPSDDAGGMAVDVAPAVTHETDDRDAELLSRLDGEG